MPQILKILRGKSGEGISVTSCMCELVSLTAFSFYCCQKGYPISSYGDICGATFEAFTIAFLTLYFGRRYEYATFLIVLYSLAVFLLCKGFIPDLLLWLMQLGIQPLIVTGKVLQIVKNFRNGHTGRLSGTSIFGQTILATVMVFNTFRLTGDVMVTLSPLLAAVGNLIISLQIIYYWKETQLAFLGKKIT